MNGERGFTLIELLVSVVIMGAISSAVTSAIIVGLKTTDTTSTRLAESHDAQMTAAEFVKDVQSADTVSLSDAVCAGATPVVSFDRSDQGMIKTTAYFVSTVSGERRVTRRACTTDPSTGVTSNAGEVVVVHNLGATGPTVTCTPACPAAGASTPRTVVVSVTDASGYNYSLTGNRRPS
ncbi:MAG: type II secretion system protein J [Actinomycetota bacterium]|nr:type II secretion system GspH family protein [Actinomycetota bacterium]